MNIKIYITFGILALGILIAPLISNLLQIPISISEILFGILIGSAGLKVYLDHHLIYPFSYFGFLLLMFLAGLEIKIKELKNLEIEDLIFIIIPVFLNFLVSIFLVFTFKLPIFFLLIFNLTSIGVAIPIFKELNLFKTSYGKTIFFIGVLGEAFSLFLLTIFSLIFKFKNPILFLKEFILLIFVSIFAYLILKFIYLLVWWFPTKFFVIFTNDSREFGVRLSIAILLILSSLFGLANIEPIIGAFITGVLFGNIIKRDDILEDKFSGLSYGFFIPIFFINIGINFSFPEVNYTYFFKILLLFIISKIISSLPLSFKFGFKAALGAGLLLSAPLTLLIASAEFGKKLGILNENEVLVLILLALVTGIICPTIFKLLIKNLNLNKVQ